VFYASKYTHRCKIGNWFHTGVVRSYGTAGSLIPWNFNQFSPPFFLFNYHSTIGHLCLVHYRYMLFFFSNFSWRASLSVSLLEFSSELLHMWHNYGRRKSTHIAEWAAKFYRTF
jgi:hypothetical protein